MSVGTGGGDGGSTGYPFEDFPEPDPSDQDRATVTMQVEALLELRDPENFRELVEAAQRRRPAPRGDGGGTTHVPSGIVPPGITPAGIAGSPVVQFELAPSTGTEPGYPSLVAVTELLIRIERLPALVWAVVRLVLWLLALLRVIPFRLAGGDGTRLARRVARLRAPHPVSLEQAQKALRLLGRLFLRASLSYCVTTAGPYSPSGVQKPKKSPTGTPHILSRMAMQSAEQAWTQASVRVAVIDTGLTDQIRTDGALSGVAPARGADDVDPLDVFPRPGFLDLAAGHGTFVAGIIRRVLKPDQLQKVAIRAYRAADSDGFAFESDIAAAMVRAADDGADLVNVSCGARTVDDGPALALQAAVELIAGKAVVVAASGNLGGTFKMWPAGFAQPGHGSPVVSVASLKAVPRAGVLEGSAWACHGPWVSASTIGEGVRSTFVEGPSEDGEPSLGQDPFVHWSGTSFAAPQVTGGIARLAVDLLDATTAPPSAQAVKQAVEQARDNLLDIGTPVAGYGQALYILRGVPS